MFTGGRRNGIAVRRRNVPGFVAQPVGCALACSFCMTGKLGFIRNLTPAEILGGLWTMRWEMRCCTAVPIKTPTIAGIDRRSAVTTWTLP